jgi:hypothetical protein
LKKQIAEFRAKEIIQGGFGALFYEAIYPPF